MLIFPKTLLQLWSDYHSTVVDVPAIVAADLGESLSKGRLKLRRVVDEGLGSEWTQRHAEAAATRLSDWCVRNGRYFCNVILEQEVDREAARWPTVSERTWWQLRLQSAASVMADLKIVPFASGNLAESELLLIDAPICLDADSSECDAYLRDVPSLARRDDDARVPLMLSDVVRKRLRAYASTGTDWIPFCRTLGIIRGQPRGRTIEALQISVRTPKPVELGWPMRLIDEANTMKSRKAYSSDDDDFLKSWIRAYRHLVQERAKRPEDADPAAACGAGLAAASGYELASAFLRLGGYQAKYFLKDENNPFLNAEGFWIALASILPAWRDRFPLTRPQVDALLASFDATYDEAWKNSIRDLALSGLFRFTPEVMARVRVRVAGLSPDAESS
jgi:hypothetical protein